MPSVEVTLDEELARALDALSRHRGYEDRASAIVDLLRAQVDAREAEAGGRGERLATLTFFHAPSDAESSARIARLRADRTLVVDALARDLADGSRFECLVLQGPAAELRAFVDELTAVRGVRRARYETHPVPRKGV